MAEKGRSSKSGGKAKIPGLSRTPVEAGHMYCFRTRPCTEFSPPHTGRYAAIRIIGVNRYFIGVGVIGGTWPSAPAADALKALPVMMNCEYAQHGSPAVFGVSRGDWKPSADLDEFTFAGAHPLPETEAALFQAIAHAGPGSTYATLRHANSCAEGEWRWQNDRDAFLVEVEQKKAKAASDRAAAEERYRTRLRNLTWEQFQSEVPFERWSPSPPYPPKDFILAARTKIREAGDALQSLGSKPSKVDVRAILKALVMWFNDADQKAGGVIETSEREDIFAVLEELAHLAGQKSLVKDIDEWREW